MMAAPVTAPVHGRPLLVLSVAMAMATAMATPALAADDADNNGETNAENNDDAGPLRAVTMLPLVAGDTITSKQAAGLSARLRTALTALADEGAIKLLPPTKDDDKVLRRCAKDPACYTDAAKVRGADVVVFGTVSRGDGGLLITVAERQLLLVGDDATDAAGVDRLVRELTAPDTLRGSLAIEGEAGDTVTIDGTRRGTIGDDGFFVAERLREGSHPVVVSRPEGRNGALYEPFTRDVAITHRVTTPVKVTLLPKETTGTLGEQSVAPGPPVVAIVGVAVGSAIVVGGAVTGVFSLLDSFEVEKRAEAQQLVFPRDAELVSRGRTLALTSTILYATGAVVAGAGAVWWALGTGSDPTTDPASGSTP